jgi:hypothetical protein
LVLLFLHWKYEDAFVQARHKLMIDKGIILCSHFLCPCTGDLKALHNPGKETTLQVQLS